MADQPDNEYAQPVQQCQHGEVHQRAQPLLGDGAAGEAVTKLVQDPAQHGLGGNGHESDEAQNEQKASGSAAAGRTLIEQAGNGGEMRAEHGNGQGQPTRPLQENGKSIRCLFALGRLRLDNHGGRRRLLGGFRLGAGAGRRGRCRNALGLELLGHRIADGIDQRVELLLRHALWRRDGRLGLHCDGACREQEHRQHDGTEGNYARLDSKGRAKALI